MSKNIAAFFDIDGTLHRDSLMIEHFRKLTKFEIIDPSLWHNQVKYPYVDWDNRVGNYDDYLLELAEIYIKSLIGINKNIIDYTSKKVISQKSDKVYKFTRSRIKWHLKNNHKVIFISGSPDFLVEKMAQKYNATDFVGSRYEFNEGIFTGNIHPMWDSKSKNRAIDKFIEKYNVDISKSYSYGDTSGDFSMLKKVGNPVAINPTSELITFIKQTQELAEKAKIIIERKDVIYHIDPSVEIE